MPTRQTTRKNEEPVRQCLTINPLRTLVARFVSKEHSSEANLELPTTSDDLKKRIEQQYQVILARGNVEDPMGNLTSFSYPSKGALVRPPYTSYAHFLHVLDMCDESKPVSIYLPQDPLLRSAALSVCLPRIQNNNVDLMYVEEDALWDDSLGFEKIDIVHMSWWRDRWAIANQGDKQKGICYLAGNNTQPEHWFEHASLKQTKFYQQRFQVLFDGFINEPRRKLRPGGILPLLDIFQSLA